MIKSILDDRSGNNRGHITHVEGVFCRYCEGGHVKNNEYHSIYCLENELFGVGYNEVNLNESSM